MAFETLFKYLPPDYAAKMAGSGSVRIGRLLEYRMTEGLDAERGDAGEGTQILHGNPGKTVYNSIADLPAAFRNPAVYIGPNGICTEGENAINIEQRSTDLHIYCTTECFDAEVMNRFGGACVVIKDVQMFFYEVEVALKQRTNVVNGILARCVYRDRRQNMHLPNTTHAALAKPPTYSHQREVRAIWEPKTLPIEAFILECPNATSHCERFA